MALVHISRYNNSWCIVLLYQLLSEEKPGKHYKNGTSMITDGPTIKDLIKIKTQIMSAKEYVYNSRLKELHASDYEMVKGEPDIRGWKVNTVQNQEIGKIVDLLFDEVSKRVRYLIVDLNGKPLNLLSRNIIIPVGLAELHRAEKVVFFPELTVAHLASLPTYEKGRITN